VQVGEAAQGAVEVAEQAARDVVAEVEVEVAAEAWMDVAVGQEDLVGSLQAE